MTSIIKTIVDELNAAFRQRTLTVYTLPGEVGPDLPVFAPCEIKWKRIKVLSCMFYAVKTDVGAVLKVRSSPGEAGVTVALLRDGITASGLYRLHIPKEQDRAMLYSEEYHYPASILFYLEID